LLYGITIVLSMAGLYAIWLLTRRTTRVCPECRSHVPGEAAICRFCTSELQEEPTDA